MKEVQFPSDNTQRFRKKYHVWVFKKFLIDTCDWFITLISSIQHNDSIFIYIVKWTPQ